MAEHISGLRTSATVFLLAVIDFMLKLISFYHIYCR